MSLAPRIDKIEKNAWINGNFDFWQRIAGNTIAINTATPQNFYTADRIINASAGPTVKNYSIVRSSDVPTAAQSGFTASYSFLFTANSAISSPAAADVVNNEYRLEGYDYARFHGKTAYLNFWVKNSVAGTYPISVYANTPVNQSLVTSYTVNSPNTWEFKSLPITFQSAGPYAFDNTWQISIRMIAGGIGSSFNAAAVNTWQSGNWVTHSSITGNVMGAAGQTTRFSMVSLTETAIAQGATYERAGRTLAGELSLCQRYYEKSFPINVAPSNVDDITGALSGIAPVTNGRVSCYWAFGSRKRASPTFVLYSVGTATPNLFTANPSRPVYEGGISNEWGVWIYSAANLTIASNAYFIHAIADAEL